MSSSFCLFFVFFSSHRYAPLYTVFSAPNYTDIYKNKGGFMVLGAQEGLAFTSLSWADHPYHLKVGPAACFVPF